MVFQDDVEKEAACAFEVFPDVLCGVFEQAVDVVVVHEVVIALGSGNLR